MAYINGNQILLSLKYLGGLLMWDSVVANGDGTFTATDSEGGEHTLAYTADSADRVSSFTLDGMTKSVSYDAAGNITAIGSTDVDLNDMPAVSDYDFDLRFMSGPETLYAKVGLNNITGKRVSIMPPKPDPPIPYGKRFFKGWGYDWRTTTVVSFPIQATTPAPLYAIFLDSYRDELYEWFNIDKTVYPYVFINCSFDIGDYGYISIYFMNTYSNYDNEISAAAYRVRDGGAFAQPNDVDPSDLSAVVAFLKSKTNTTSEWYSITRFGGDSSHWCYGSVYPESITIAAHYDDI